MEATLTRTTPEASLEPTREARFVQFVRAHRDRAVGMAWQLTGGDRAAAEDVAQEAFLKAYRALPGFRGDAALSTWFFRILVRQAHDHRRWRAVRDRVSAALGRSPAEPTVPPEPEVALRRRIRDAVDRLPRGQREVFVLVYLQGLTLTEAAETLGRAPGTVKSHLHRALRRLRAELGDLMEAGAERKET